MDYFKIMVTISVRQFITLTFKSKNSKKKTKTLFLISETLSLNLCLYY